MAISVPNVAACAALLLFPSCEFSGQTQKIVPGYGRRDEGPGRMRLLPGYVAGNPEGTVCIDSECGGLWNPLGASIGSYDIGGRAGPCRVHEPGIEPTRGNFWDGEAVVNGQPVQYAVFGEGRPNELRVCFPRSDAHFMLSVGNEADVRALLRMVLSYQGAGYTPDAKSTIDVRLLRRDGTGFSGITAELQRGTHAATTSRTDDDGHVRFAGVAPGPYYLSVRAPSDCASVRQRWKISVQAAEIELRWFTVTCEQGKK